MIAQVHCNEDYPPSTNNVVALVPTNITPITGPQVHNTALILPLLDMLPDQQTIHTHAVQLIIAHLVFQEKTKEWISALIDEKHIAQHRAKLLTAKRSTDEQNETFMDQLEFWYMESEKQATQIATMKVSAARRHKDLEMLLYLRAIM
jgi:hypothetical protein